MQLTLLAILLPGALAALAAPSFERRAEWKTTTEPVDLSPRSPASPSSGTRTSSTACRVPATPSSGGSSSTAQRNQPGRLGRDVRRQVQHPHLDEERLLRWTYRAHELQRWLEQQGQGRKINLKATFEADVTDAGGINRIVPQEVFYQLNGKRIGVSRSRDSEVGSGSVIIPPGGSIQACGTAFSDQVINMLGAVTSLVLV